MKSLTSANPRERKLAVAAVLIALPEQGPVLVRTIAEYDEDASVQSAARNSLEQRVDVLIRDLFSPDAGLRINAAQELIQGWRNEPSVVFSLIDYASRHTDNSNGVYYTVVVLNEFPPRVLLTHKQEVLNFIALSKATGTKTATKAQALAERLEY